MKGKTKIEIQHFHGCPNSPKLIERVKEAIKDIGSIEYKETIVDSSEKAVEVKFRGSPTLLINGKDFEGQPIPDEPALMCRYYPNGLPEKDEIKNRIYNESETLSCKLTSTEFQKRKATIISNLKQRIIAKKELKDGYALEFPGTDKNIDELIEFVKAERGCCDFFTFNIFINQSEVWLELTGDKGVKEFIINELLF